MEFYIFLVATISTILGIVVWAVRLEGRINTAETRHTDLKELIESKFLGLDQRLERIEGALNGFLQRD